MKIQDDRKVYCSGIIYAVYRFQMTRNKEPNIRNYLPDTLPAAVEQDTDCLCIKILPVTKELRSQVDLWTSITHGTW